MTTTIDRPDVDNDLDDTDDVARRAGDASGSTGADLNGLDPEGEGAEGEDAELLGPVLRPLLVAFLASGGASLMAGGIFGSWGARGLSLFGAAFGVGWAWLTLRSGRRLAFQAALVPAAFVLGILSLVPTTEGPLQVGSLIGDAITSGRLLRPPVPFDAGWRPILIVLMALVGYAAAWVATALKRPQMALLVPLPILALTAISQPAEGEFIGGVLGFLPLLVALGLLFGGDGRQVSELGRAFEIKRAIRTLPVLALGLGLMVLLSQTDVLFPKPAYNPAQKPQKPKAVPLGKARDRVLFEIDGAITGPWKTGVLDFYDGGGWRLPPFDPSKLLKLPKDGVVDKTRVSEVSVKFTVRDLGTSAVLPGVVGPTKLSVNGASVLYDPRPGIFRMATGRVPDGFQYEMSLPAYPNAEALKKAGPVRAKIDSDLTYIPKPPPAVKALLDQAPINPFDRMNYLREKLNEVVVASGPGVPNVPMPTSKVDDLLVGSHEGTPFQIVAAEAMLARWAGVPSRIAFGFDSFNDENGKKTLRPKNGANWIEVYFEGYSWVPIIGAPPRAKSALDNDPNAKFDPSIVPSDDIAVELYIPTELKSLKQLYQRIRELLLEILPLALGALAIYLGAPAARRTQRRIKRRRWARGEGPRAQIAVEYCEFRDAASDLNLGDPFVTPLEYLDEVVDDAEHAELAWLVTRANYGDLATSLTDDDIDAARAMSASLRRRMARVQPFQSRALGVLSRASLRQPYSTEVPNVTLLRLRPKKRIRVRPTHGPLTRTARIVRAARRATPLGRNA